MRWQQCCARQRNKCCILCSAPGTRQSQCECRTPKTHTNRRTHTHTHTHQTNTRFLSMLFIIPASPFPYRSTPPAIVKNLCCVFHIQLGRRGQEQGRVAMYFSAFLCQPPLLHVSSLVVHSLYYYYYYYVYLCMYEEAGGRGEAVFLSSSRVH